jgi:Fe-S cluster assembly ATPase SufC
MIATKAITHQHTLLSLVTPNYVLVMLDALAVMAL